jgi:transposase
VLIIGCDYHPSVQQIAWWDQETGACGERRLEHGRGEAERFYRELSQQGKAVLVGMEACGHTRWFEQLLSELGIELWLGNPSKIAKQRVRSQKTDRRDAQLLLELLEQNRFPRLWVPSAENRDLRHLLWHRHRLVQMRSRVKNQLQAIALNQGVQRKHRLWSRQGRAELESWALSPWAAQRRHDLLQLLDQLTPRIRELDVAVEREALQRPEVRRLMRHPGVGPITALAFVLVLGTPERFKSGKQVGSYLGLIPCEDSSGEKHRWGHLSKQGNGLLRYLLIEAVQTAVRCDAQWRRRFLHLAMRRQRNVAIAALARKLAVSLYWLWRNGSNTEPAPQPGSHVG